MRTTTRLRQMLQQPGIIWWHDVEPKFGGD